MEIIDFTTKREADDFIKIEITLLKRYGYLKGWKKGAMAWTNGSGDRNIITVESSVSLEDNSIRLIYSQTDIDTNEKKNFDYKVKLTTTKCNYGGERYWFICPITVNGQFCGRRVGVLYGASDYFGCRHCYNLTYNSRNDNRRGKNYYLFRIINAGVRADELETQIKRKFYAGRKTRKQRMLEKLYKNGSLQNQHEANNLLFGS